MVAVGSGDCDKHLYEFQLCICTNKKYSKKRGVYIWGECEQEGDVHVYIIVI